jgi:hypothetical protein
MAADKEAYTPEQLEYWSQQLEELALQPRTRFNKKQTVEALIIPIQKALLTHSYEYVAEQLQAWGLDITSGCLKQYVTRYLRECQPGKRRRKSKETRVEVNSMEMTTVEVSASVVTAKELPGNDSLSETLRERSHPIGEFVSKPRRAPEPIHQEVLPLY